MVFFPLLLKNIIERPVKFFPNKEIVCGESPGIFRYTYRDFYARMCRLANVLEGLGVRQGDTVSVFAESHHRALELNFTIPSIGAVVQPVAITIPKEVIIHVVNNINVNRNPKVLFLDEKFVPLFEEIKDELKAVKAYVIMADKKELPETSLTSVYSYEELIDSAASSYIFPEDLNENSPALLANTTGTTGLPKGFFHTHRGIFLHSLSLCMPDVYGFCCEDVIMLCMPLWYFSAWNHHFAAALAGAKIVLPYYPDGKLIGELVEKEKVTFLYGVSSFIAQWIDTWQKEGWKYNLSSVKRIENIGATRMSPSLLRDLVEKTGITILPGMGYSEACPIISSVLASTVPKTNKWEEVEEIYKKDGMIFPLLKFKMINERGEEIKWDGKELGRLGTKGPHIIDGYIDNPEANAKSFDKEGYFYSGDVGVVSEEGYITTKDRIEDLIRGESGYVSPSTLEGIVGELPFVKEAGAVGIPYGEFEKPVVCVVLKDGYEGKVTVEEIRKEFEGKIPGTLPEVIILDKMLPRGPTGKYEKRSLKKLLASCFQEGRE